MDDKGKQSQPFSNRRVAFAFLATPLIPVALSALWADSGYPLVLIVGVPVAYFATALIAAPLVFALRALDKLNLGLIVLVGVITTVLPFAVLGTPSTTSFNDLLPFAILGASGGLAGWLIAAGFTFKVDAVGEKRPDHG